jgi:hypothetical protein
MIMKKHLGYLSIFAALAACRAFAAGAGTNEWGVATNELQISISTIGGKKHFKTNEPLTMLVRLRNLSVTNTFYFMRAHAIERTASFSYTVIAPSGKDVSPPRPFGYHGSGTTVGIRPGDIEEMQVNLSELCVFGETGTYRITMRFQRAEWREKGKKVLEPFEAVSNTLNVSIGTSD